MRMKDKLTMAYVVLTVPMGTFVWLGAAWCIAEHLLERACHQ